MKNLFLALATALTVLFASTTNECLSQTSSAADTLPNLSDDQVFNLCYSSLNYWWGYSNIQDALLQQYIQKVKLYEKMTGVQAQSVEDLERLYRIREAQIAEKDSRIDELEGQLKKANRRKSTIKVGMFVITPAALLAGVYIGTKLK
jgi:hypothetical protein